MRVLFSPFSFNVSDLTMFRNFSSFPSSKECELEDEYIGCLLYTFVLPYKVDNYIPSAFEEGATFNRLYCCAMKIFLHFFFNVLYKVIVFDYVGKKNSYTNYCDNFLLVKNTSMR